METKMISMIVSLIIIVAAIVIMFIRISKNKSIYTNLDTQNFLNGLKKSILELANKHLTIDNITKLINKDSGEFIESENYMVNVITNDLYETLYKFIVEEAQKYLDKDIISNAVYKLILKNKDIANSITYNFITSIIESKDIKDVIYELIDKYWEDYTETLDKIEEENSNYVNEDDYYVDDTDPKDIEYEKSEIEESDEDINPQSDEEIPFDPNIDEVVEDGEEEVTYFFDKKGRKRDKKTGRYTK